LNSGIQTSIPFSLLFIILVLGVLLYFGLADEHQDQISENIIDSSLIIDDHDKFAELTNELEKLKTDMANIAEIQQQNLTLLKENVNTKTDTGHRNIKSETLAPILSTNTAPENDIVVKSPEEKRSETFEYARLEREHYDTTMNSEAINPNWSLSTEQKIEESFEKFDVESSSLISKEC